MTEALDNPACNLQDAEEAERRDKMNGAENRHRPARSAARPPNWTPPA